MCQATRGASCSARCAFYGQRILWHWSQALAAQDKDAELKAMFTPLAKALTDNEAQIIGELTAAQGKPVDMGGYYHPDFTKTSQAMRPSATFNAALGMLG